MELRVSYDDLLKIKDGLQKEYDYQKFLLEHDIITKEKFDEEMQDIDALNERVNKMLYAYIG
jgi:hypothetical protein